MSELENHWEEVARIEAELKLKMIALGLNWNDSAAMAQLAVKCKAFHPADAQAAYQSRDFARIVKTEIFALASTMLVTMTSATGNDRDVHSGEVWKAFAKHLYDA
jgi:hypothetical protein